jgi:hypothetical protein
LRLLNDEQIQKLKEKTDIGGLRKWYARHF